MDHIAKRASTCRVATPKDVVNNSECVYTFHSPYTSDKGIVVSLSSFVGTVDELAFVNNDVDKGLFVRICKKRVTKVNDRELKNVTKIAVGVEGGFQSDHDKYETISTFSIVLLGNTFQNGKGTVILELIYNDATKYSFPAAVSRSADSIINHAGFAVQQDVKAWELKEAPKLESKYANTLPFVENGVKVSSNPADWKCEYTGEKNENLWLNLSDGFIGGGRKNWDGTGGTNGALHHFVETGKIFPLVVKLGTITEDINTADCYSYAEDEDCSVMIPNLKELLEKRGIMVAGLQLIQYLSPDFRQKTIKSTAELEVELNATYAFDAITEAGAQLVPVAGPGLQGLQNLGNSCYVNSIAQILFSGLVPEISRRYGATDGDVTKNTLLKIDPSKASNDILCQTAKLSSALTSGVYCRPLSEPTEEFRSDPKYRLAPRMFKHAIGHDHEDFKTSQQQDAAQYFQYLLEKIDRAELGAKNRMKSKVQNGTVMVTSHLFSFQIETRYVCGADNLIKYTNGPSETMLTLRIPLSEVTSSGSETPDLKRLRSEEGVEVSKEKKEIPTVTFDACLEAWSAINTIDDYRWPHLQNSVSRTTTTTRFVNFPRYLLVQMQRYKIGEDWRPQKIEVDIDISGEICLQKFKGTGPQSGETLVPPELNGSIQPVDTVSVPIVDGSALAQLLDMGFDANGCKRALVAVGGSNVEAAMNWIFEHNGDPDFNDPLPDASMSTLNGRMDTVDVDENTVSYLVYNLMGYFTADQVRSALAYFNGAPDQAADWLYTHQDNIDEAIASLAINSNTATTTSPSIPLEDGDGKYNLIGLISHIGKNTDSGHYVAHLKKDGKWFIFNDEDVALSIDPPMKHAYMYLFQRNDTIDSPHPEY